MSCFASARLLFKGEPSQGVKGVASRKLCHALHASDKYLRGQAAWLVNYAKRHHAGLRVGTSLTESTANFLVNRRMNKAQQMRWSREDADQLQVRCAVYNGRLGAGFGHRLPKRHDPPDLWTVPVQWLLHRPMNAQQQMRWTRRDAHLMRKVRCAVINGTFEHDHAVAEARACRPYKRAA